MRNRFLIANWKMNVPPEGVDKYLEAVSRGDRGNVSIVVAPPFPFLTRVAQQSGVEAGAQNCSDHVSGAYTGEVSPRMLRDCGARYVILGHSERRSIFHESDAFVARKLALALDHGLTPVLCIGEDSKTRDAGHVARHLAEQIKATAVPALETAEQVILAYEPIWAIGTGRNASGPMVAETMAEIRHALERFWPTKWANALPILYGGSVTPENTGDLVAHGNVDGFLVGGACLDAKKFLAILQGLTASRETT
ncbi:MAG TPA: triose-phosphate isomerase [Thermoanaerobaculia bacterium]|nr:triose-phosphate isomerase [Thermoanaerobaculia bacterium]